MEDNSLRKRRRGDMERISKKVTRWKACREEHATDFLKVRKKDTITRGARARVSYTEPHLALIIKL